MKIWLAIIVALFIFSGCTTKHQNARLRSINAKQAAIIKKQNLEITMLRAKFASKQKAAQKAERERKRSLRNKRKSIATNNTIPKAPKKNIVLKKVEDTNYSSGYMYPGANKTSTPKEKVIVKKTPEDTSNEPTKATSRIQTGMTKAECISMIGADKFAKYTEMFGSESASLKRCKMLKAMKE